MRGSSRVYGRERSGKSPVRPFRSRGEEPPSGPGGPAGRRGGPRGPRRRISWKAVVSIVAGLLVVLLVAAVALFFVIDSRLAGIDGVLDDYEGGPPTPRAPTGCSSAPTAARA
ncbi:hypothetical protein ACFQ0B_10685 [Nonomuraea thailandensis]